MRNSKLAMLNFMALCCVLGIFSKKLVNPFANIITETLHIPGGVSTGFSIMFLVIATEVVKGSHFEIEDVVFRRCGTLMGTVQGFLSLALGRVGSMGLLMPIAFIATGMAIDFIYQLQKYIKFSRTERMVFSNALAAVMASVIANAIVFHLRGAVLGLYLSVSGMSGILYGFLGSAIAERVSFLCGYRIKEKSR